MSLLFINYYFVQVTYLLITFSRTRFFPWNTKNTDRYGVNKQNTRHNSLKERYDWKGLVGMRISDRVPQPFSKTNPYFTNPSLFMVKIWTLPFWENFEKITPPPIITEGGFQLCNTYVKYFEELTFLLNIFNQSTFLLLAFNLYKSEYSTLIRNELNRDLRRVNLNKQKQGVLVKKCS